MKVYKLEKMKKGWFVGNFEPTVQQTEDFEVAYRTFEKGAREAKHVHRVDREITVLTAGKARMNERVVGAGDIVVLEPGEATDFEGLEDGAVVIVKSPSVPDDKYRVNKS